MKQVITVNVELDSVVQVEKAMKEKADETKNHLIEKYKKKDERKKVAIRLDPEDYEFIRERFGERGFTKFANVGIKTLIKIFKENEKNNKEFTL